MKTKEQTKIEIRKIWKYKDRKCVILWVHNHFCAYVETNLKGVSYSQEFGYFRTSPESNISCHGGLTFAGELKDLNDNIWYFGCDYIHSGDYIEEMEGFHTDFDGSPSHKWTLNEVEKNTNKMCNSILKYEKVYDKYKELFENFQREIDEIFKEII